MTVVLKQHKYSTHAHVYGVIRVGVCLSIRLTGNRHSFPLMYPVKQSVDHSLPEKSSVKMLQCTKICLRNAALWKVLQCLMSIAVI